MFFPHDRQIIRWHFLNSEDGVQYGDFSVSSIFAFAKKNEVFDLG